MAKTVVILGGAYAGLHIAHYLLKQKNKDVKVVLVSKVRNRALCTAEPGARKILPDPVLPPRDIHVKAPPNPPPQASKEDSRLTSSGAEQPLLLEHCFRPCRHPGHHQG